MVNHAVVIGAVNYETPALISVVEKCLSGWRFSGSFVLS
jgi:hypothetical protein